MDKISMSGEQVKKTAIPSVGYAYQALFGVRLLCDWLNAPSRYRRFWFECDDSNIAPQSLDDIVAERDDGRFDYWQVKYTPNTENNALNWDWLLKKTKNGKSNIQKWFNALQSIAPERIGSAQLVTNKIPDRDIDACLANTSYIQFELIPAHIQKKIEAQLGDKRDVEWLFANLHILHSYKGYLNLEAEIGDLLYKVTDHAGISCLILSAQKWLQFRKAPNPEGSISLADIQGVISYRRPQPLDENFLVPEGYCVPDQAFHEEFLEKIRAVEKGIFTLTGPPGRGKSTYLSYLCNIFPQNDILPVRHHYYLSEIHSGGERLSSRVVEESLKAQLWHIVVELEEDAQQDPKCSLQELTHRSAELCKAKGKKLAIILDGLDHVWRENYKDIRPLEEIFRTLLHAVGSVIIIIGTQPVDDHLLPKIFLQHSPKEAWQVLPPMSLATLNDYVQQQTEAKRLRLSEREKCSNIARGLHDLTQGHPLLVIYAIEQLINLNKAIKAWDLEQLPGDLSAGVNNYYNSLWSSLSYSQKDILIAITEFPFFWPPAAFTYFHCIPQGQHGDLERVMHLLHHAPSGFSIFHNSLSVFIKSIRTYHERVEILLPNIESWLKSEAPEYLKNIWLWQVQAQQGNIEPIIKGITRDWVLNRLSEGYRIETLEHLLNTATSYALRNKLYAEACRIRHIENRLYNGLTFQLSEGRRLLVCSWKLARDKALLLEAFSSYTHLSYASLSALGLALKPQHLPKETQICGDMAVKRYEDHEKIRQREHERDIDADCQYFHAAIGQLVDIEAERFKTSTSFLNLLNSFLSGLTAKGDISQFIDFHRVKKSKLGKGIVERYTIRTAILNGVKIEEWPAFDKFTNSYFALCLRYLIKSSVPKRLPKKLPLEELDPVRSAVNEEIIYDHFFATVFAELTDRERPSLDALKNKREPEWHEWMQYITECANYTASMWRKKQPLSFADFYRHLRSFSPPQDIHKHYSYEKFCWALMWIAIDCHLLSSLFGTSSHIIKDDIIKAKESKCFSFSKFKTMYAENGIKYISECGVDYILENQPQKTISEWMYTSEYAENILELTEVALLHGRNDVALDLCKLTWDFTLGYGYHKDYTILSLLTALEYTAKIAPRQTISILSNISPQISNITEYTDGKETSSAHEYTNNLLTFLSLHMLATKYASHVYMGDWSFADETLAARFAGNLESEGLDAIARTGLPDSAIGKLYERAQKGEKRARQLYQITCFHNGSQYVPPKEQSHDSGVTKGEKPNYAEYPPQKLDEVISAIEGSIGYSSYLCLPEWYEYWVAEGKEYNLIEELVDKFPTENEKIDSDYRYVLDLFCDSFLKFHGKQKTFKFFALAQRIHYGWASHYESTEASIARLEKVIELYPKQADEFIRLTCVSPNPPHAAKVPSSSKLVFFLARLGRIEEALDVASAIANLIKEETKQLPMTTPDWANEETGPTAANPDIRFLAARTKWPVPAVKWWALHELAGMLHKPKIKEIVTEELRKAKLETECIEQLFIFWLAKQKKIESYGLAGNVNARSCIASLLLSDILGSELLHEGKFSSPQLEAPENISIPADLKNVEGKYIPPLYPNVLKRLEQIFGRSFHNQYVYEWQRNRDFYPDIPLQGDMNYFYPIFHRDKYTGQFSNRATHRGRSAYLRSLEVVSEFHDIALDLIKKQLFYVMPLDPTLAELKPNLPKSFLDLELPSDFTSDTISLLIKSIDQNLEENGLSFLALPLTIGDSYLAELTVYRLACFNDNQLIANKLFNLAHSYKGAANRRDLKSQGFSKNSECPVEDFEQLFDKEAAAVSVAGRMYPARPGYLHPELTLGELVLPLSTRKDKIIQIIPNEGKLQLDLGGLHFGTWEYWNSFWKPTYLSGFHHYASMLAVKDSRVKELWTFTPTKYTWVWRLKMLDVLDYRDHKVLETYGIVEC